MLVVIKAVLLAIWNHIPGRAWLYICLLVAAFGIYEYWASHERALGETNLRAQIDKANEKAELARYAMQKAIDAKAGPSNADLQKQFDKIQAELKTLGMTKPNKPLAVDCRYDDERVNATNKALRQ